jgi:hypothetical protein
MKKYLEKYPTEKDNIDALIFAFGIDKTEDICNEALTLNKKIEITNDLELLDLTNYEFV